jgi:hypothetical protein
MIALDQYHIFCPRQKHFAIALPIKTGNLFVSALVENYAVYFPSPVFVLIGLLDGINKVATTTTPRRRQKAAAAIPLRA